VCAKYGRIEEIAQMEATRRERPTIELANRSFEPAKGDMEARRIAIDNMKAGLRIEINGIPVEKITDKDTIAQVASENASGKYYRKAIDPNDQEKIDEFYQAQGKIGEIQAKCVVIEQLGMEIVAFDQKYHGVDIIAKDKDGNFAIIEAKLSNGKDGPSSLNKATKQMTQEWVDVRLDLMQGKDHDGKDTKKDNELYSPKNAEIAREIKSQGDRVEHYVIHTNPDTLNMIVSQRDNTGNWQYHSAYRSLEK
jgi:hypothetical protein